MKKALTFEMNGIAYLTDRDTLRVLRSVIPNAKKSKDFSAVAVVMELGLMNKRIINMGAISPGLMRAINERRGIKRG